MLEDFQNALKNFKNNKIRTFLSLLGVIIGVTSVIIITTLGSSAAGNVKETMGKADLDLVNVSPGLRRHLRSAYFPFNDNLRETLMYEIPEITEVFYVNNLAGTLRWNDVDVNCPLRAVETGFLESNSLELNQGRSFNVSDNVEGLHNIVLGKKTAEMLFGEENPVGQLITIDASRDMFGFRVIGVLESREIGMEQPDSSAYIPRGFYEKKIKPNPEADYFVAKVTSQNVASKVQNRIEEYADEVTGLENTVVAYSLQSYLEQYDQVMGTFNLMLSGIAAISLLVGGIGIMNIMIVTVTERKKEIGIRKALGARPLDIKIQFLVESATISLAGGILGIILGIVISIVAVFFLKWKFTLDIKICLYAFLFSAGVGVFFGLNPASRAAKLDPVEALAHE